MRHTRGRGRGISAPRAAGCAQAHSQLCTPASQRLRAACQQLTQMAQHCLARGHGCGSVGAVRGRHQSTAAAGDTAASKQPSARAAADQPRAGDSCLMACKQRMRGSRFMQSDAALGCSRCRYAERRVGAGGRSAGLGCWRHAADRARCGQCLAAVRRFSQCVEHSSEPLPTGSASAVGTRLKCDAGVCAVSIRLSGARHAARSAQPPARSASCTTPGRWGCSNGVATGVGQWVALSAGREPLKRALTVVPGQREGSRGAAARPHPVPSP